MKEICPHCGRFMNMVKIPIRIILKEVGMIHGLNGVKFDFTRQIASRGAKKIKMTKTMWKTIAVLLAAKGGILARDDIMKFTTEYDGNTSRTVDTSIAEIRKRCGNIIKTNHGQGYSIINEREKI